MFKFTCEGHDGMNYLTVETDDFKKFDKLMQLIESFDDAQIKECFDEKLESELENEIDEDLKLKIFPWPEALVGKEYPLDVRNRVARKYISRRNLYAVAHITSSENNEEPGITSMCLFPDRSTFEKWNSAFDHEYNSRCHLILSDDLQ